MLAAGAAVIATLLNAGGMVCRWRQSGHGDRKAPVVAAVGDGHAGAAAAGNDHTGIEEPFTGALEDDIKIDRTGRGGIGPRGGLIDGDAGVAGRWQSRYNFNPAGIALMRTARAP